MSKYYLRKPLKNINRLPGEIVEIGEGDCILLDDCELRDFNFTSYFEKVPEPRVVEITTRQWEGSDRIYVGIQFPSRCNMIWIDQEEVDQLQDAINNFKNATKRSN